MTEVPQNTVYVKIAEVKTAKSPDRLKATLGSCIGIAFIWKEQNKFGLAHCLLPITEDKFPVISARYVSQAIPSLLVLMKITTADIHEIHVEIAGGGNMISQLSKGKDSHVGTENASAAIKLLKEAGFKVSVADTGGDYGRNMTIDCSSGKVKIEAIKQQIMQNIKRE